MTELERNIVRIILENAKKQNIAIGDDENMDNQNLHLSTGQLETGPVQGSWAENRRLIICRAFVENQPV